MVGADTDSSPLPVRVEDEGALEGVAVDSLPVENPREEKADCMAATEAEAEADRAEAAAAADADASVSVLVWLGLAAAAAAAAVAAVVFRTST